MSMEEIDILLLEDRPADAELVERELTKAGLVFTMRRVAHQAEYLAALEAKPPSIVLSDVTLPGFDGVHALRLLQEVRPGIPLIFVSGTIGEERAVELLKVGATDYVLKDRLARLGPAITRALRDARLEQERQSLQGKYENIFSRAVVGIFQTTVDGGLLMANPAVAQLFGLIAPRPPWRRCGMSARNSGRIPPSGKRCSRSCCGRTRFAIMRSNSAGAMGVPRGSPAMPCWCAMRTVSRSI